jgi:hypothetical protein
MSSTGQWPPDRERAGVGPLIHPMVPVELQQVHVLKDYGHRWRADAAKRFEDRRRPLVHVGISKADVRPVAREFLRVLQSTLAEHCCDRVANCGPDNSYVLR